MPDGVSATFLASIPKKLTASSQSGGGPVSVPLTPSPSNTQSPQLMLMANPPLTGCAGMGTETSNDCEKSFGSLTSVRPQLNLSVLPSTFTSTVISRGNVPPPDGWNL